MACASARFLPRSLTSHVCVRHPVPQALMFNKAAAGLVAQVRLVFTHTRRLAD
jgi:hypothetical protein